MEKRPRNKRRREQYLLTDRRRTTTRRRDRDWKPWNMTDRQATQNLVRTIRLLMYLAVILSAILATTAYLASTLNAIRP